MLSPEELQARIAAEFLRVGASQQSWDQNFPSVPSVWVQDAPGLPPTLSSESRERYEAIAGDFFEEGRGGLRDPDPEPRIGVGRLCLAPSVARYIAGQWVCVLEDGSLVTSDPDEDDGVAWVPDPVRWAQPSPVVRPATSPGGALPQFVGGRLGRVLFPQIANRRLTGVRVGTLPQVVFGDEAPASYGTTWGVAASGGGNENLIQP